MRVIAGTLKGRKLKVGRGKLRPTSSRVRTAIFNILPYDLADALVLDLYAGTGAMGIEALSRRAREVVFVDHSRDSARALKDNLVALDLLKCSRTFNKRASAAVKLLAAEGERFDLAFLDPPYQTNEADKLMSLLAEIEVLSAEAVVVVEHDDGRELQESYGALARFDRRRYGATAVSFYQAKETGA